MDGASIDTIRINGGRLCLDFINTAAYEAGKPAIEFVTGFDDLVRWGLRQELIAPASAGVLRERAEARPKEAAKALEAAMTLRASLRTVFEPGAATKHRAAGLAALTAELARAAPHLALKPVRNGAEFAPLPPGLETWLTGPLALSAIELVTSKNVAKVHMCPGDVCHWLFLDVSRNGTRRWCSMESCGNRAKVRAHYETKRRARV
jgi:predicted RNA-binding Zn ribbon-like protein